ncbi:MAG: hypothetical protein MUO50_18535 [Longimicrobiales bacterium]|nr:hypothetical protein [Longimicrobiales bacterium]
MDIEARTRKNKAEGNMHLYRIGRTTWRTPGVIGIILALAPTATPLEAQSPRQWRLASPDFEVGGFAADSAYALATLGGVTVLENGNVVIGDRVAPFLKVFDPRGEHLRDVGRSGQGPGEYEYLYEMDWCAPGELSVFDVGRRVHRYTAEMTFVSTELISLDAIGGGVAYHRDCHPNGFQVVTGWGDFQTQSKVGLFEATAPVVLLRGQEVVRDFGERLSSQRLGSVRADGSPAGSGPHPFGRATVVALGSDKVYIGDGEGYEIEVYDLSGSPLPPLRWAGPSLRYDHDLVEQLGARAVAEAPERSRPQLRRWYAEMPKLDQLPGYDRILVSDTDEVWVRQFARPGAVGEEWVIFGADHELVGRLAMPPRSTLWEVRGGRVVYSVKDELDVPIVRVSRIER